MHRRWFVPFLVVTFAYPACALAQATDSVVFRHGQWGADFSIGGGFAGVGAIRFSSPTRALVLDLLTDYQRTEFDNSNGTSSGDNVGVQVRLGTRGYRSFGRRLYRLTTFGVSASYRWGQSTVQDTLTNTQHSLGAGVFADLGASWLVTPQLALGARWGLDVTYNHDSASGSNGSASADRFGVSLGRIALIGQLYF
jgi:hypothetical protein